MFRIATGRPKGRRTVERLRRWWADNVILDERDLEPRFDHCGHELTNSEGLLGKQAFYFIVLI